MSTNINYRLGFTNYVTIAQVVELFPELDYVDHSRRIHIKVKIHI